MLSCHTPSVVMSCCSRLRAAASLVLVQLPPCVPRQLSQNTLPLRSASGTRLITCQDHHTSSCVCSYHHYLQPSVCSLCYLLSYRWFYFNSPHFFSAHWLASSPDLSRSTCVSSQLLMFSSVQPSFHPVLNSLCNPNNLPPEGDSYSASAVCLHVCLMCAVGFGDHSEGSGWMRPHGAPGRVDTVAYPEAQQQPLKRGARETD